MYMYIFHTDIITTNILSFDTAINSKMNFMKKSPIISPVVDKLTI